jgi:hypothetical protein
VNSGGALKSGPEPVLISQRAILEIPHAGVQCCCNVAYLAGFGEALPPQSIGSGGCGTAVPHHNHQKKAARGAAPRAPDVAVTVR